MVLASIILLGIIPVAQAKPRRTYLTDFIFETYVKNDGFSNSDKDDKVSYEATAYALEILDFYDLEAKADIWGNNETVIKHDRIQDKLETEIDDMFEDDKVDLYDLYFLLMALETLETTLSLSLEKSIKSFIEDIESDEGGFTESTDSSTATLSSTYFALKIYSLIEEEVDDEDNHIDWVNDCQNDDGGFGNNEALSSSVINTYYAILIMDELGGEDGVDDLDDPDEAVEYLNSFYVDDENDIDNYGGFLPDDDAEEAMLSSTFYCVSGISLLDDGELEDETLNWISSRQNVEDGGFIDTDEGDSSVIVSYFAFKALKIFDEELGVLEEDVFMVEFNWWVLILLLTLSGVVVAGIYYYWRKRRFY